MSEDQQGGETTTKHLRKTLVRTISYKKKKGVIRRADKTKTNQNPTNEHFSLMVSTSYIGEQNNNRSMGPRQHSIQT